MCGIAGIFDFKARNNISRDDLYKMIKQLHHRGPDGTGIKLFDNVGLAHTRLSIIDLETGDQPITNEDKTIWTIFNGEIFNYIELRNELIKKGHTFTTKSDTEVIVHLYEEYGENFPTYLNGQFSIAIYDTCKKLLLICRDRTGIIPIFYTQIESKFYFASEIKSLLSICKIAPSLNRTSLDQIFTFWAPLSPATSFENIYEVSPGEMLSISMAGIKKSKYWDWSFPQGDCYLSDSEADLSERLKELLIDATKIRLRSDVPVGAYLSGGIDSSTIVALIANHTTNPLHTFSIGFSDKDFDESTHQRKIVDRYNTRHSYMSCDNSDISNEFIDTIWHTESPVLRTAPVPMKLLSSMVNENNYKVVLTGEGADEVLGGYDIFKEAKIRMFWAKYPESTLRPKLLARLYPYLDLSRGLYLKHFFGQGLMEKEHFSFSHMTRWSSTSKCKEFFSDETIAAIKSDPLDVLSASLPKDFDTWNYFNKAQYIESKTLMTGYLLCSQGDRMLMANSVEGRFPFLDHRLIEFSNSLNPNLKMRVLNEKYLLKKCMRDNLPMDIVNRHKQPYRAPNIPAFFNSNNNEYVNELLSEDTINKYSYFNARKVQKLVTKIKKMRTVSNNDNMALVGILSTQIWHYLFVENFNSSRPSTR